MATGVGDPSPGIDDGVGATIRLWRAPNRIWPAFPTLVVVRAASRLGPGRAGRRSPAIGEGGVVTVFLDGSKVGTISTDEIKVYRVSPGGHSLSVRFLGGLRRSRKRSVPLAKGEDKQLVCWLNGLGWPSIRSATPEDVAAVQRRQSPPVRASDVPKGEAR